MSTPSRELLADFREVEHNFRLLDRKVREKIALWEGSKGALLDEIMGERDAIADSDQGRSFRAFWDFLMSSIRQEELSERLDKVLGLPAVAALKPDVRTRRVHYDWLEAGEHTQRTVAQLSQQLRRFLNDAAFLENRRIMDLLHGIESKALALREAQPVGAMIGEFMVCFVPKIGMDGAPYPSKTADLWFIRRKIYALQDTRSQTTSTASITSGTSDAVVTARLTRFRAAPRFQSLWGS